MAIEKHTRKKKLTTVFDEEGGVKRHILTVDDGYLDDGVFASGQIRDIEADDETVAAAYKEAKGVSEAEIAALRDARDKEIAALRQELDDARAKIERAQKALQ